MVALGDEGLEVVVVRGKRVTHELYYTHPRDECNRLHDKSFVLDLILVTSFVLLLVWYRPTAHIAHVHVDSCRLVRAARRSMGKVRASPYDPEVEADLVERGFPVTWCRCTKGLARVSLSEAPEETSATGLGDPPKGV
jgi:hypothetical protein